MSTRLGAARRCRRCGKTRGNGAALDARRRRPVFALFATRCIRRAVLDALSYRPAVLDALFSTRRIRRAVFVALFFSPDIRRPIFDRCIRRAHSLEQILHYLQ